MNAPLSKQIIGNTSLSISTLGLGGAPFGGLYEGINTENVKLVIAKVRSAGINYYDADPFYGFGLSQRLMGDVLRGDDYVLTTKVGRVLKSGALDSLETFIPKCADATTSLVIGSPFNSGILVGADTWNYETAPAEILNLVTELKAVCTDHNVPLPATALQFPLANSTVASVIPGPRTVEGLEQTLEWTSFDIPNSLWSDLAHPA